MSEILDDYDKQQIVNTLNKRWVTTLSVEMIEVAVIHNFMSWEALQDEAQKIKKDQPDA